MDPNDRDGDGIPDYVDSDGGDGDGSSWTDTDGDGTPDAQDWDDDGDWIPDLLDPDADGSGSYDVVEAVEETAGDVYEVLTTDDPDDEKKPGLWDRFTNFWKVQTTATALVGPTGLVLAGAAFYGGLVLVGVAPSPSEIRKRIGR